MEGRDLIEHRVVIDQFTTVSLKIPKEMTALELKGMMTKATKMFNLSEVEMVERVPRMSSSNKWTPEIQAFLYEQWNQPIAVTAQEIQKKFGANFSTGSIYAKRKELRDKERMQKISSPKLGLQLPVKKGRPSAWTTTTIEIFNKNKHLDTKQILALMLQKEPTTRLTTKSILDRRYYQKKHGV